jgi:hypothetical protein
MTTNEPTGILATINTQPAEQTLAQLAALQSMAERERLAAADAAISAHDCDLGPEYCEECDRLWATRADAHDARPAHLLLPCWECREDGEPWCHDCDQCNPDGMFLPDGTEREA